MALGQTGKNTRQEGWRSWKTRLPTRRFDLDAWLREGQRIDGGHRILQRLLRERTQEVDLRAVAFALGCLGRTEAVPDLVSALGYSDPEVRAYAAAALGELAHPEAIPALAHCGLRDAVGDVRAVALLSLGQIGGAQARAVLEQALMNDDEIGYIAAEALRALDRKEPRDR